MQSARKRIETENLILDTAVFSDWEAMYRNLWSQEESAKYMRWRVTQSAEEAQERMRRTIAWQKEHPLAWTVFRKAHKGSVCVRRSAGRAIGGAVSRAGEKVAGETIRNMTGEAIGFAGITKIADGVYEDTGIAVGPAFVRRGYGRQIVGALLEYCFWELGAERFVYSCRSLNLASCALALSCGFRRTHSETRTDPQNGSQYVLEFYEQRREDFEQCREAGGQCMKNCEQSGEVGGQCMENSEQSREIGG